MIEYGSHEWEELQAELQVLNARAEANADILVQGLKDEGVIGSALDKYRIMTMIDTFIEMIEDNDFEDTEDLLGQWQMLVDCVKEYNAKRS